MYTYINRIYTYVYVITYTYSCEVKIYVYYYKYILYVITFVIIFRQNMALWQIWHTCKIKKRYILCNTCKNSSISFRALKTRSESVGNVFAMDLDRAWRENWKKIQRLASFPLIIFIYIIEFWNVVTFSITELPILCCRRACCVWRHHQRDHPRRRSVYWIA